jgi:hypothetical protein
MPSRTAAAPPAAKLTWPQVSAYRLRAQYLTERVPREQWPCVVSAMGAAHGQLMSAAELSICARADGVVPDDVRAALWEERRLVKTWGMRGTLHLFTREDLPLYVAAGSFRTKYNERGSWLRYFDMTLKDLHATIDAVRRALAEGSALTREELAGEVARLTRSPALGDHLRSGWGSLLKPAAFKGYLCFGPNRGQNVTFVDPEKWLGEPVHDGLDPDEAMDEVLRRFMCSYGPATREEFARWFGMQPPDARPTWERMADELAPVEVEGEKMFALKDTVEKMSESDGLTVRLLPHFDPYTIAVSPRMDELLPRPGLKPRVSRKSAWFTPVVLVDGRIDGVWEHKKGRNAITVTVEMFREPTARVKRGIGAEAERLGELLGAPAEVKYGPIAHGVGASKEDDGSET